MSSHLSMNIKPISGPFAGVIAHTVSFSSQALPFFPFSISASQFLSLNLFLPFAPFKLDSGNITMLFSLFPSLWPNCLVFQGHWALVVGCSCNRELQKSFYLFYPIFGSFQNNNKTADCIQFFNKQFGTDDYLLHTALFGTFTYYEEAYFEK